MEHKSCILFIVEFKISSSIGSSWRCPLNFSGFLGVDIVGRSGGLLLFWNHSKNILLRSYSVGHIDCLFSLNSLN